MSDKKEPTKGTRERLPVKKYCPPQDVVHDMWLRARKAPGRLIELPIEVDDCEPLCLTVETDDQGERPQWNLYAGVGASRVLWNYLLSDTEMIHEILTLSVSSVGPVVKEPPAPAVEQKSEPGEPARDVQAAGHDPAAKATSGHGPAVTPASAAKSKSELESYAQKNTPNVLLGHILVDSGLIPEPMLDATLSLQEMVRQSKLTPDEATDVLRKLHSRGPSALDDVIAEIKRKRLDEPPTDAVNLLKQAGFVSDADIIKAKHIVEQLRKAGLETSQGDEIAKSLVDLLKVGGLVTDDDVRKAVTVSSSKPIDICKALLSSGAIDALCFDVASRFVKHLRRGTFKQEQAIIALHYSQRSRTGFEETVHSLGWKVPIES